MARLPTELTRELDKLPAPWSVENGTKHKVVRCLGRRVLTVSYGKISTHDRERKNDIATIRRFAREIASQ